MPNTMNYDDIHAVANAILKNAQGETVDVNYSDFVTVADTALKAGYDPLATAISQVLSKTIFSYRPYSRKFKGLYLDSIRWGNHVRKLNPIDKELEKDNRFYDEDGNLIKDGSTIDQYKINKPEVVQTNFYGADTYQKSMTVFKDQLDNAFTNEAELGNFLSMVMGNATDQLEQAREDLARATVVNLIGATVKTGRVIHLLSEYNAETGETFTKEDIMKPANFKPFFQWVYAKIQTTIDAMTERTHMYHVNPKVGGVEKKIRRHTPIEKQHLYMLAPFINKSETMAIAETFHDDYLDKMDYEKLNFWQYANNPGNIKAKVSYLNAGGEETDSAIVEEAFENNNIVGVLFDEDAAGVTLVNQWSMNTPFNAKGGYYNTFWHETARFYNDTTENAIVFALD